MSGRADPGELAVAAVSALSPYLPGKPSSELQREYGVGNIIKLASNENAWGPSPAAIAAVRAAADDVWIYPDGSGHELRSELSRFLGVDAACVTLGNGSNELLVLLAEAFLDHQHSAVYSQYGFAVYPLAIKATGARAIESPALDSNQRMRLGHDLRRMLADIRADTRLVFIANPNNPTGTWLAATALREFLAAVPAHLLVVLDEAYLEFGRELGTQDAIGWLGEFPNLVLLRTFSKAYGLAGLRVGYAVSHPGVAAMLNRLRPAFNVNSLAQVAALAAVRDQAHLREVVQHSVTELRFLQNGLTALGLEQIPSAGNFILVRFGEHAGAIYEQLLRAGIIVRPVVNYALPEYLRITVGTRVQNERLLAALASLPPPAA